MGQLDASRERESENAHRDIKEWTGVNERSNARRRERAEVKGFGQAETDRDEVCEGREKRLVNYALSACSWLQAALRWIRGDPTSMVVSINNNHSIAG